MYKVWWMKKENNYGDLLTPYIFDHFNIPFQYAEPKDANTICVGSILSYANENSTVLGSGLIRESQMPKKNADYKFVRGPLTRNKILSIGGECPELYGDAALLLPLIWGESKKEHEVGVIPHIWHYNEMMERYPGYNVIDLHKDPKWVTKEITKCKKIISSSLHGVIVAHAYGIPAAWVKFSKGLVGDEFKFHDYFKSVNREAVLSTLEKPVYIDADYDIKNIKEVFENL